MTEPGERRFRLDSTISAQSSIVLRMQPWEQCTSLPYTTYILAERGIFSIACTADNFAMMNLLVLSSLALLLVSASARVRGRGGELVLSQIRHHKLRRAAENQSIEGQFIIVLSDAVEDILQFAYQLVENSGAELNYEYNTVIKGFSVSKVVADFLMTILDDSMVDYVEEVRICMTSLACGRAVVSSSAHTTSLVYT